MPIPLLLAAAPALASGLFGAVKGVQALNQSKKIKPDYYSLDDPRLTGMASEFAKQRLGLAQTQLNAQDPFAAAQQRGILGSQAGAMASAQRSVTDPAQALAMTAAIQGNTNQAMFQQGLQNQQNYQQRLANLTGAQEGMIQERDKAFQERMNKFLMDQQRKDALQQAGSQSLINAGSSLGSSLIGIGKIGGFGKLGFGKGSGGGLTAGASAGGAGMFGGGGSSFIPGIGGGYQTQGIGAIARAQGLIPKGQ